jgi:hypothetical protein
MAQDIMAESQTEAVLAELDRGATDDRTRDHVLAALLRSQTRMLDELSDIKKGLWDLDKLKSLIDERHRAICTNCSLRHTVNASASQPDGAAGGNKKKSWPELILTSESTRYFVLMVILVWAIVYVKSGAEGVANVRDSIVPTMHGGVK